MTDKPSPLALKLHDRITRAQKDRRPLTPIQLDEAIVWHEQVRQDAKRQPSHSDNTLAKGGRESNEYLAISLHPNEGDDRPWDVWLYRYCVPSCCDTYSFSLTVSTQYHTGGDVRYSEDRGNGGLARAMVMVAKDLARPNVIAMIEKAINADRILSRYGRDLETLLGHLAPRSKVHRLVQRRYEALRAKRVVAFNARYEAREALRAKGATDEEIEKALGPVVPITS